jgi:hypothetical protein
MNIEERKAYITKFRITAQRVRSIFMESSDNAGMSKESMEIVGESTMPWLFGRKCILPMLDKMEVEPTDQDIVNLNWIYSSTPAMHVAGVKTGLKLLDPMKIFESETLEGSSAPQESYPC